MKQGVYRNISNADYHGGAGVSKSGLDLIAKTPAHFKAARDFRDMQAANSNKPTAAQAFGTAFHMLVLEPAEFEKTYVVGEKFDRRTKEGKAAAAAFDELHGGKTVLDPEDMETLLAMAHAVRNHKAAAALLYTVPGEAEVSVYWTDPITGVLCRCRPDFWRSDDIIVDLKTTIDASPYGFAKSVYDWRYHTQDPFYTDGISQAAGRKVKGFVFIAVEKKPPYCVGVYVLDEGASDLGRDDYRRNLKLYAECEKSGEWPAYSADIERLNLPAWAYTRADNDN